MSATLVGNPNYQIVINQNFTKSKIPDISVTTYMPDKFMFNLASNYETPFAQGLLGSGMISNVAAVFGYRMITPAMTAAVWTGSSSSELALSLEFFSETNTASDVTAKVLALMSLTTPNVDSQSGLITSPGPKLTITGAANAVREAFTGITATTNATAGIISSMGNSSNTVNGSPSNPIAAVVGSQVWKNNVDNRISIKIGNYAFFDCVVVTGVDVTHSSLLDASGKPTHVIVNLRFRPMFIVTQDDLNSIFLKPNN